MKKKDVKIGTTYRVKVTGKIAEVRITGENAGGGWDGINVVTNRKVRIKSAQRLRSAVSRPAKRKKIVSLAEYNAEATNDAKATKKRNTGEPRDDGAKMSGLDAKMSGLDAAASVLAKEGQPMGCKEIVTRALAANLWRTNGKTPAATIYAAIIREIATKGDDTRFRKVERGKFTLAK